MTEKTYTYEQVKKLICPYCAAGLPDYKLCGTPSGTGMFVHNIPRTREKFDCLANDFRMNP